MASGVESSRAMPTVIEEVVALVPTPGTEERVILSPTCMSPPSVFIFTLALPPVATGYEPFTELFVITPMTLLGESALVTVE